MSLNNPKTLRKCEKNRQPHMPELRFFLEHNVHWVSTPTQKHHPPLKCANYPSPPFLGNPPIYWLFVNSP